jgi:hypothetical protein
MSPCRNRFIRNGIVYVLLCFFSSLTAQELYPNNEPASTMPKGVIGVRLFQESYKELSAYRQLYAFRLMYGVLPKLSLLITGTFSNHHGDILPPNLITHTHNGGQTIYSTGNFQRGVTYPYRWNGVHLFAKYRFLTYDKEHGHIRMAVYGEGSNINVAHDETEPDLMEENKGYGAGLITTWLHHHLALSLTSGFIHPLPYKGYAPDTQGGPDIPTTLQYGKAFKYNFSAGYLLYPSQYQNYRQTNWNIYLELMGKAYGTANVIQYGTVDVPISTPLLLKGNYMDICPGIQAIIRSNLRIDFSVRFPMINRSYAHFYPLYMLAIQRYFYPR